MLPNTRGTNVISGASTTTTIKSGGGFLSGITINTSVTAATLTIYDNTAASGTKIGTITLPVTIGSPAKIIYDCNFSTGLTVVSTGLNLDFTVVYA